MDTFTLRPTIGKRIIQVNVNFVEEDIKPQPAPQPAPQALGLPQVKPEDIKIRLWTHQNTIISQDFVKKYLVTYINEQIIPAFGKFVIDWLKQVSFDFDPSNSDEFSTGQAGSMTVTIHVGKNAKKDRFVDYLSAETVKSFCSWTQIGSHAFNQMVNVNFSNNRWVRVVVDGEGWHGLQITNMGIHLGSS